MDLDNVLRDCDESKTKENRDHITLPGDFAWISSHS